MREQSDGDWRKSQERIVLPTTTTKKKKKKKKKVNKFFSLKKVLKMSPGSSFYGEC